MAADTCPELVSRDRWRRPDPCGRKVVRDGLCGIHAAAADRRKAKADATQEAERVRAQLTTVIRGAAGNRLSTVSVCKAEAWQAARGHQWMVTVDAAELANLLSGRPHAPRTVSREAPQTGATP